jgi:predicted nucleotidyltransferase component of viral defense system
MLRLEQVKEYFGPDAGRLTPKGMLVEYAQYELLDSLYKLPGSEQLSFIGGTAIRIVHGSRRFSEDLDFDNFGLTDARFRGLIDKAGGEMALKGFDLEKRYVKRGGTNHCYLRFRGLLQEHGISGHRAEKLLVSVDADRKERLFTPETVTLNRFGVFRQINADPAPVLLSQKLLAILQRRRAKGRDFYDASFLGGKTKPDYRYLTALTGLSKNEFTDKLTKHCRSLDYKKLLLDVEAFLFDAGDHGRVLNFLDSLPGIL